MRGSVRKLCLPLVMAAGVIAPLALAGPALGAAQSIVGPIQVTCFGEEPTITGTDEGETIEGTPEADVIVGLEGDDTINGKGGNDLICGDQDATDEQVQNDTLNGGSGDDKLLGTESPSSVMGGWASGGKGDDLFRNTAVTYKDSPRKIGVCLECGTGFGWGEDTLENVVNLEGSQFNDGIGGNRDGVGPDAEECGCDFINGLKGRDVIHTFKGWDDIHGGPGDDKLYGGRGNDEIYPGKGDDKVYAGKGAESNDLVSYFTGDDRVFIDIREGIARGLGRDRLVHIDSAQGTRFADELWGDGDANTLAGAAGRDELHGRKGGDTLFGNEGKDKLFGGNGPDIGFGGAGHDVCNTEGKEGCEE